MIKKIKSLFARSISRKPDSDIFNSLSRYSGGFAKNGMVVNSESAMRLATVWACVSIITQTISTLPLHLMRRDGPGGPFAIKAVDHPLYSVFYDSPNESDTRVEFMQQLVLNWLLEGNAFAIIERNAFGQARLHPWPCGAIEPVRSERNFWETDYKVKTRLGEVIFTSGSVLHIRGMKRDGLLGLSPIAEMRETISEGMVANDFLAYHFANGGIPGGILSFPGASQEALAAYQTMWNNFKGAKNGGKTAFFNTPVEYKPLSVPFKDVQFLELRNFNAVDICKIYQVPPHMVGDLSESTKNNIEQQGLEFKLYCIQPRSILIEERLNKTFLSEEERKNYSFCFNLDGVARGDLLSRTEAHSKSIMSGYRTINEIRSLENLPPSPDGDTLMVPLNMVSIKTAMQNDEEYIPPVRSIEHRAMSFQKSKRDKIRLRFEKPLRAAWQRVIDAERSEIEKLIAKRSVRSAIDISSALRNWYDDRIPKLVSANVLPVLSSFSEFVSEDAALQAGLALEESYDFSKNLNDYNEEICSKYRDSSIGQLAEIETIEEVAERVAHWKDTRAEKETSIDLVKYGEGLALALWGANGIKRKVWVAKGQSCPLCQSLSGRVAEIAKPYLSKGDTLNVAGSEPLTSKREILHAPLHRGCDCSISPSN